MFSGQRSVDPFLSPVLIQHTSRQDEGCPPSLGYKSLYRVARAQANSGLLLEAARP